LEKKERRREKRGGKERKKSPTRGQIQSHLGLVWEMGDSSGWKRIEGDFSKF
jgi:hypothetical protein